VVKERADRVAQAAGRVDHLAAAEAAGLQGVRASRTQVPPPATGTPYEFQRIITPRASLVPSNAGQAHGRIGVSLMGGSRQEKRGACTTRIARRAPTVGASLAVVPYPLDAPAVVRTMGASAMQIVPATCPVTVVLRTWTLVRTGV